MCGVVLLQWDKYNLKYNNHKGRELQQYKTTWSQHDEQPCFRNLNNNVELHAHEKLWGTAVG